MTIGDFLTAVVEGNLVLVKEGLKDPNIDITTNRNVALRYSAEFNDVEIFELLINDSRIKITDSLIKDLLNLAASKNSSDIVDLLITKYNANPMELTYSVFIDVIQKHYLNTLRVIFKNKNIMKMLLKFHFNSMTFEIKTVLKEHFNVQTDEELRTLLKLM
jgi:ankyrin repeat protein